MIFHVLLMSGFLVIQDIKYKADVADCVICLVTLDSPCNMPLQYQTAYICASISSKSDIRCLKHNT